MSHPRDKLEGMCDMCDGKTLGEHLLEMHLRIAANGWYLMLVEGNGPMPPWGYTVGLSDGFRHPELLMVGAELETMAALLNSFAQAVVDGEERYAVGDEIVFTEHRSVHVGEVHPVHAESNLLNGWDRYYRSMGHPMPDLEVVQLILDDGWFCSCHGDSQIRLSSSLPLPRPDANRALRRREQRDRRRRGRR